MIQAPGNPVAATGSPLCQSHVVLSPYSPKTGWSSLSSSPPKPSGPLTGMAAEPGVKSQLQSSSAAPFPTPPTISYTCQHSHILLALLGCYSKSGQVWPHGVEPIFSKLSLRYCNQGGVAFQLHLGWKSLPSPWLKANHSYLTYP